MGKTVGEDIHLFKKNKQTLSANPFFPSLVDREPRTPADESETPQQAVAAWLSLNGPPLYHDN